MVISANLVSEMIYYELAILGGIFILALVALASFGRPMAEAYAEKVKLESREAGSEKTIKLEKRVEELEKQLDQVTSQMLQMQETLEFTSNLVDSKIQLKQERSEKESA